MGSKTSPTNMVVLQPSRKAPREGDIFTFRLLDGPFRFGRVIDPNASIEYGTKLVLIYIYDVVSDVAEPPLQELTPDRLLIPPQLTNRLAWSRGYFQTVGTNELQTSDLLPRHVFWSRMRESIEYFDEHGRRTFASDGPMALFGVTSYATIDDRISEALGIPLAPDPSRR